MYHQKVIAEVTGVVSAYLVNLVESHNIFDSYVSMWYVIDNHIDM